MKKNRVHWFIFMFSIILIAGLTASCITVVEKKPSDQTTPQSTTKTSPPSINSFTADPATTTQGKQVYLNWNVSGATEVTISPVVGKVDQVSTVMVSPETTTTYTLTASNDAGNSTAKVTVEVTQAVASKPDLVITDIWIQVKTVYYKIKNLGGEKSPGTRTYMYLNDIKKIEADDYAEPLEPGEEKTESFGRYEWNYSPEQHAYGAMGQLGYWASEDPLQQHSIRVCADSENAVVEENEDNNCHTVIIGDKMTLSFTDVAHLAYWTTNSGVLDWPVPEGNKTGSAFVKESITMEDGRGHSPALATYPEQVNGGWIDGIFSGFYTEGASKALMTRPVLIPRSAKFTAEVGFKKGAIDTDGVWFTFGVIYENGTSDYDQGIFATYDEKLDLYEVDLSHLAGEKVSFVLSVEDGEGSSYQQNYAVWIDPKITQETQ